MCGHHVTRTYNNKPSWIGKAYNDYTKKRQTFADLFERYGKSPKTIRKAFDEYYPVTGEIIPENDPVNIVIDATFFKRGDGYLVARANSRNLHWFTIETEKVEHYGHCLHTLETAGFSFASFTIGWEARSEKATTEALSTHTHTTLSVPSTPNYHSEAHTTSKAGCQ